MSVRFDVKSKTHAQHLENFCHAHDIHVLTQRIHEIGASDTCIVVTRELAKFKQCMLKEYPKCHIDVVYRKYYDRYLPTNKQYDRIKYIDFSTEKELLHFLMAW